MKLPAPRTSTKVLVVEGKDDLHSVVGLMQAHIEWPESPADAPVDIRCGESKDAVLKDGYLTAFLKASGIQAVGVMLDADNNPLGCYGRIRDLCSEVVPGIPPELPATGLIVENGDGVRLGVWVMPDNASHGDLETFLRNLIPGEASAVWMHAVESTARAKTLGATYRLTHLAKANMHAWLAWQDSPGRPFGTALTARTLDPRSPSAEPFVRWFRELYRL